MLGRIALRHAVRYDSAEPYNRSLWGGDLLECTGERLTFSESVETSPPATNTRNPLRFMNKLLTRTVLTKQLSTVNILACEDFQRQSTRLSESLAAYADTTLNLVFYTWYPSSAPMDVHRQDSESPDSLVYDGECPFCSAYVKLVRLRKTVGAINLVDARQGGPLVDEIVKANIDLNEGMVLKLNGQYYHGADCINMLALLSTPSSAFNRLNAAIFRSKTMSRVLYPILRLGRAGVLRILGRSKIEPKDHQIRGTSVD